MLPRAGGLHILGQTSPEAAGNIYTHTSTASNSIDMDPFLLQTVGLSSDFDAVHFGGDLVDEEDENCCVEAECHFCYLRDSSVYVHESCCLGNQRHPLTYVGRRRFWYGPLTKYGS